MNPGHDDQQLMLPLRERGQFRDALARAFHTTARINSVLDAIGFPMDHRGAVVDGNSADIIWNALFVEFDGGALYDGYRRLLSEVHAVYEGNPVFRRLVQAYPPPPEPEPEPEPQPLVVREPECTRDRHVMIRASSPEERRQAEALLAGTGAEPDRVWTSNNVTLFRINSDRAEKVLYHLEQTDLLWTMIEPGQPTYLLSEITVFGPDGRGFRHSDVPAVQRVGELAEQTMEHYPPSERRNVVTDRIGRDGQGERVPAAASLHDAHVPDGARLRIGHETRRSGAKALSREEKIAFKQHLQEQKALDEHRMRAVLEVIGFPVHEVNLAQAPALALIIH